MRMRRVTRVSPERSLLDAEARRELRIVGLDFGEELLGVAGAGA